MSRRETNRKTIERLARLEEYNILDSATEQAYDNLVKIASELTGYKIAAVSFLDRDRQWFKAILGLEARETPLNLAFCRFAVEDTEVMVVHDATQDERFCNNPLVTGDPNIRAYAGAPLRDENGIHLGTVCVIDSVPRTPSSEQLAMLASLADQVMHLLRLRMRNMELTERNQRIEGLLSELQVAHEALQSREEALSHAAKMSSLGEMAAGIAHEINNPLTSVTGYARRLERSIRLLGASHPGAMATEAIDMAGAVTRNSNRIADVVRGLTLFAREGQSIQKTYVSLPQVLEDTLTFCRKRIERAEIRFEFKNLEEVQLFCQPTLVSQALLNLLNNAYDAVAGLDEADERWISLHAYSSNHMAVIEIRNGGPAIDPAIQAKVFDPFFTTKGPNQGTGLGLGIAHGIATKHGGGLELASGCPVTFRLQLSLQKPDASQFVA